MPDPYIPQSPFVNLRTGYVTQAWLQWLLNPQVQTVVVGTPIDVPDGGTGLSSGTSGGILGFTSSTTIESSSELAANEIVLGGGAGNTPSTLGDLGNANFVLHGNAAGAPAFSAVVTTDIQDEAITTAKIDDDAVTTAKIINDAVTFAKIQTITDNRLLGRSAGSDGDMMHITVGSGLSLAAGTLTNTATTAASITVANEATDTTCFPVFVTAATGDLGPKSNAGLIFNSNTGDFRASSVRGGAGSTPLSTNSGATIWASTGVTPIVSFVNTGGAANSKIGDIIRSSTTMEFRFVNDAYSSTLSWITATGAQAAMTSIALNAPLLTAANSTNTVLGNAASVAGWANNQARLQLHGATNALSMQGLFNWANDTNTTNIAGHKSRNASVGSHTIVQNNDPLLQIIALGSDGTNFEISSYIGFEVDGPPGANDMPGRIVFYTTPDASATPAEAMRISNTKLVTLAGGITVAGVATLNSAVTLGDAAGDTITVTGTPAGQVIGSTYSPVASAASNLDATPTMQQGQYMRVGATVTVSGTFTADPTAAGAASFEVTLPVASNIGAVEDCAGVAFAGGIAGQGAAITGSVANNTAVVSWIAVDVTSQSWSYTFTYQII